MASRTTHLLAILLLAIALSGTASCTRQVRTPAVLPPPDLSKIDRRANFDAFSLLGAGARTARRDEAQIWLDRADEIAEKIDKKERAKKKPWLEIYEPASSLTIRDVVESLEFAAYYEPDDAGTWTRLSSLYLEAGKRRGGRRSLELADAAFEADPTATDHETRYRMALNYAWLSLDEGLYDDASHWAETALTVRPGNADAKIVLGLSAAESGDVTRAHAIAQRIQPLAYPDFHLYPLGLRKAVSGFAQRWIKALAYSAVGDCEFAKHALGRVNYRRIEFPLMSRYWNDVGLIYERCGNFDDANLAYGTAYISLPKRRSLRTTGFSIAPVALGVPHRKMQCFLSASGDFVAGSYFTYAANWATDFLATKHPAQHERLYRKCISALGTCVRKNFHPAVARSLMGRCHYRMEAYAEAEEQLLPAYEAFRARGEMEERTVVMLGKLKLMNDEFDAAMQYIEEALAIIPESSEVWGIYAVALLETGETAAGRQALEKAVDLDDTNAAAYFNRGLTRVADNDYVGGIADLERAFALEPDDEEILHQLQLTNIMKRDYERRQAGDE